MKKKTLVPLITFLLGICLISLIVYKTDTHEKEQRHITAQLNVATYGEQIKNEITNGIEITDTLKQILISEDGEIRQFETIAGNLMSDSIESVQLAPNGVVTDIYPAGKIDLFRIFFQIQSLRTFKFWIRIQSAISKTNARTWVILIKWFINQMGKSKSSCFLYIYNQMGTKTGNL